MSNNETYARLTLQDSRDSQVVYVCGIWFTSDFSVSILDGSHAYLLAASKEIVEAGARELHISEIEYLDQLHIYLTKQYPHVAYRFSSVGDDKLLTCSVNKEGVVPRTFKLTLRKAPEIGRAAFEIMGRLMNAYTRQKEELARKTRENERRKAEAEVLLAQIGRHDDDKREMARRSCTESQSYEDDKPQFPLGCCFQIENNKDEETLCSCQIENYNNEDYTQTENPEDENRLGLEAEILGLAMEGEKELETFKRPTNLDRFRAGGRAWNQTKELKYGERQEEANICELLGRETQNKTGSGFDARGLEHFNTPRALVVPPAKGTEALVQNLTCEETCEFCNIDDNDPNRSSSSSGFQIEHLLSNASSSAYKSGEPEYSMEVEDNIFDLLEKTKVSEADILELLEKWQVETKRLQQMRKGNSGDAHGVTRMATVGGSNDKGVLPRKDMQRSAEIVMPAAAGRSYTSGALCDCFDHSGWEKKHQHPRISE